jgi:NADPH:quinone reductase-like Zn-dependent oxidoreductase
VGGGREGCDVRAVVHDRYGPPEVLRVQDVERPVPGDGEVLIRVRATTVNRTDCAVRAAKPFLWRLFKGLLRPKQRILGMELAGEVEAVGAGVRGFAVGDRVFGIKGSGAYAEFTCMAEDAALARMPEGVSFEEAAAVCDGAIAALTCLRSARLRQGQRVMVYGASGATGTAAVQLAKAFGADVSAVCNTKNVELVRSLGAEPVFDYLREDFTRNGETYDAIVDAAGKHSFRRSRRSLKPGGTFVATDVGFLWHVPLLALLTRWLGDKRVTLSISRETKEDVLLMEELIETGKYRPVIERTYPLEDVVEATRYVETGQKTGNVVLSIPPVS